MMRPRCSAAWPLLVLVALALAGSSSAATTQSGVYSPATYLGRDGCGLYSGFWSCKVREGGVVAVCFLGAWDHPPAASRPSKQQPVVQLDHDQHTSAGRTAQIISQNQID